MAVREPDTALLSHCSGGTELVRLEPGHPVRLRFALAGADQNCYAVAVNVEGKVVHGYISRAALGGVEEFEQKRRETSTRQMLRSALDGLAVPSVSGTAGTSRQQSAQTLTIEARGSTELIEAAEQLNQGRPHEAERILAAARLPADRREVAIVRARALLSMTRPNDASRVLQPALQSHPRDPQLLALAGMSALQRDDLSQARTLLKQSLEIQAEPSIERLYRAVEHEALSDKSRDVAHGSRFTLRYEGEQLPESAARQLTEMLDREITRISYELGCHLNDRLPVIVQSRENYRETTGAAEWSGGRYDGRIRIVMPPSGQVDEWVRKAFSHEFTHACLARRGSWPTWLHEGLAQRLSGDRLDAQARSLLARLHSQGQLPRLSDLAGSWARLDGSQAAIAYHLGLAAVETYYSLHSPHSLRNLLNHPGDVPSVSLELDRAIREGLSSGSALQSR
jgi:hypothetical protein